jgi:hypothetical protein
LGKKKYDDTRDSVRARDRINEMVRDIPREVFTDMALENPLFRAFVTGYYAEEKLQEYLTSLEGVSGIYKPGDRHPTQNKWDRTFLHNGRRYSVQVKSPATGSIQTDIESGDLVATVHNDASDKRWLSLPNGQSVETCCYVANEYDILAVPLFLFHGRWEFAFKWNVDCRRAVRNKGIPEDSRDMFLSTTESMTFPSLQGWKTDLFELLADDPSTRVEG